MKATIACLFLLVLTGFAQEPGVVTDVDLNEQFKIKNGEEVVIKGQRLRIMFNSVFNDSRCPIGVECGWAGNAAIVIEVAKKNKKQVVAMLNTDLEPREIEYKRYKIKLVRLDPWPRYGEPIDPKDYEASLVVTKE